MTRVGPGHGAWAYPSFLCLDDFQVVFMSYLIALTALLSALFLMNLLLMLGMVRRLREQTKLIDALYDFVGRTRVRADGEAGGAPEAGDTVGAFDATTVDGIGVSPGLLPSGTVVGFLSPDCGGCREQLPELVAWSGGQDRERVVVVVDGRTGDPAPLIAALTPVAQVVVDGPGAPVAGAFGVHGYPIFCVMGSEGKLAAVGPRVSRLPVGSNA